RTGACFCVIYNGILYP
ncbi:unnamed protein product, partial [Chondrus crispus]